MRLDALLEDDEARPRREKLRITRVHGLLLREWFDGSCWAVRRYRWRQTWRLRRIGLASVHPANVGGRSLSVRLESRGRRDRGQANAGETRAWAAVRIAGNARAGLSARDTGDAV